MKVITWYKYIVILFALSDFMLASTCFRKHNKTGNYLGGTCVAAGIVASSYLISILVSDYFTCSLFSSLYFASTDVMLFCLFASVAYFSKWHFMGTHKAVKVVLIAVMVLDVIALLVNPFREICVHYIYRNTPIAKYTLDLMPLYSYHLTYCYILVVLVLTRLFYKSFIVPSQYRNQYLFIIFGITLIVFANAVYLFLPGQSVFNLLDYSICGYSIVAYITYWCIFNYSTHGMLDRFKTCVFENIDQGIVLFDYDNNMILQNNRARELLPAVALHEELTTEQFLAQCGIIQTSSMTNINYSQQCFIERGSVTLPLRCDCRILRNRSNHVLGRLFVFSDVTFETDPLTGFHSWDSFKRYIIEHRETAARVSVASVCDINGLININHTQGHSAGDQKIRHLSNAMRACFPGGTYFVRGPEAVLIALCFRTDEKAVLDFMKKTEVYYAEKLQYSACIVKPEADGVLSAINSAMTGMRHRKLLDKDSSHSDSLTSLIRALKECDFETEAHVKRTQEMGCELGHRIGLSDVEQSELALLCLLHDIGKIGIPLETLNKPGKLTDDEWKIMRTHVEKGYQIAMSSQETVTIANMILHHHERWDGTGYPEHLNGESIPLLSRVISIVDSYDAMTNDRVYRRALPVEEAIQEIIRCSGTQFDPNIAAIFVQMLREEQPESSLAS